MSEWGFYRQNWMDDKNRPAGGIASGRGFTISWQNGPLGQGGDRQAPNGAFVEDVLQACMQRLEFFENSPFACEENADAIAFIGKALIRLADRTQRRVAAGVEGTHAK